jgi:hypothetical protein
MVGPPKIELLFAVAALVLDQIAVLGGVTLMAEPSTVLSSVAIGLLLARYSDQRRRERRKAISGRREDAPSKPIGRHKPSE